MGGLRRAVALLAGGNAIATGIVAVSYPIVTRLYAPAQFGAFAAALSLLSLALTVSCLTYDRAIPLPKEDHTAGDLVVLGVLATVGLTALTAVALAFRGEQILGVFGAQSLAPYWWMMSGAQLIGGVTVALTGWAIRCRQFRSIAESRISQAVTSTAVQVLAGAVGGGTAGLLSGEALGRTSAGAWLSARSARRLRRAVAQTSRGRLSRTARRYRRFPLVGSWPTLINAISFEAPLLLIVAFYGPRTGGFFAFAQRLIGSPVALLVLAVSQVFVSEAAERARTESADLIAFFRSTLRKLALIAIPLMLALSVAAELLVDTVFGAEWHQAGTYILVLAPFYTMQLLSSPLGGTLDVLERQDLLLVREVSRLGLIAAAISVAHILDLRATVAMILLSTAGTLAYVFYGAISWHALTSHYKTREPHVAA